MASRSCPWQHEWKRPLWQKPNKGNDASSNIAQDYNEKLLGSPVCSTSARLSYEEVQKRNWFSSATTTNNNNNNGNTVSSETNVHENYTQTPASQLVTQQESLDVDFLVPIDDGTLMDDDDNNNRNDDFILTVTLFSSSSITKKDNKRSRHRQNKEQHDETVIGDMILLEVIQTSADDQGHVKRKRSRLLRWPGSVLKETVTDESEEEEEEDVTRKGDSVEEKEKEETKSSGGDQSPPQQHPKSKNWYEKMMFPWWGEQDNAKKQKSKSQSTASEKHLGLVSVSLCRKPPQDGNSSLFDALDVVNMMSLGLLSNVEPDPLVANDNDSVVSLNNNNETENEGQDEGEEGHGGANNNINGSQSISDLVLCCLTMDGRVHFYESPMKLFFHLDQPEEDLMVLELASLLMGSAMLRQIQDSLLPLSQPDATLDLSVPLGRITKKKMPKVQNEIPKSNEQYDNASVDRQKQKVYREKAPLSSKSVLIDANEGGVGSNETVDVETVSLKKIELEDDDIMHVSLQEDVAVQKDQEKQGVWDGSVWDATVEPSTVLFRTHHNRPTLSVAAFDYIAVAGQGVRKRRRKIVTKTTKHQKVSKGVPSSLATTSDRTKESETEKNSSSPVFDKREKSLDAIESTKGNEELLNWADDMEDDGSQNSTKPDKGATDWWNESEEKPTVPSNNPVETEDQKQSEAPVELLVDEDGEYKDEDPAPKSTAVTEKAEKPKIKTKWVEYYEFGGFVTLISLQHFAEERTVYLPFIPKEVSPVIWGDMQFIFVLGDEEEFDRLSSPMAVVIRVDAAGVTKVPCGEAPFFGTLSGIENQQGIDLPHALRRQDSISGGVMDELEEKGKAMCSIRRFQPIPVALPIGDEAMSANVLAAPVAVSSAFVDPPSIAVLYSTLQGSNTADGPSDSDTVVALHTLTGLSFAANAAVAPRSIGRYRRFGLENRGRDSKMLTVQTAYQPGHLARVPCRIENKENADNLWFCHIGQGWSLVGIERRVFFVCWEGATETQGAFVVELDKGSNPILGDFTPSKYSRTLSNILPLHTLFPDQILRQQEIEPSSFDLTKSVVLNLPFTSPYRMPSMRWMNSGPSSRASMRRISIGGAHDSNLPPPPLIPVPNVSFVDNESVAGSASAIDGVVVQALDSISNLDYSDMGPTLTPTVPNRALMLDKEKSLSKQEKSRRLLRHCSSWTQLESTQENRAALGGQVPIASVRLGTKPEDHFVLTLRRTFVENGVATPFNQVLSWLCHRKEYFCAASIGLDLLGDVDGLRDLRRSIDNTELAEGRANLEGLLDGIVPLDFSVENSPNGKLSRMVESTITQLADMTVGCLVKGGLPMSHTLEGLLGRNVNYDPARASLMLSAAATCAVSGDNDLVSTVMGTALKEKELAKAPAKDILWPIRCLLRIAVARDFLPTALLLLNESIPDELRRRKRFNEPASTPMPSLEFCASIVTMIVASSPDAAGRLLDLIDEQTRRRYWESLAHDTQLALALIQIDGKFPLLREPEIRSWALQHLHGCIEADAKDGGGSMDSPNKLPSDWLKKLFDACTRNAGCDLKQLSTKSTVSKEDTDGIQKHLGELQMTQNALVSGPNSGGLDFDLIIPALLLLESRDGTLWKDGVLVSTQAILDAACYLAGRHGAEEPAFPFNASTVMRQCALLDNVSAGANLIGGKDGLVLKCCDVLIEGCGMSMDEAESFILDEKLSLPQENVAEEKEKDFVITDGHRHVLWLLDEHVLSIKTFGEFETIHIRGRVDPVFASHACFRTWLRLNPSDSAAEWLVSWLRTQLGIDDSTISKKRLACAAIARALMWPNNRKSSIDPDINTHLDQVLATALGIKGKFLVQISQACCGLIEAIPPSLANDVFRHEDHDDIGLGAHVQVGV